MQKRLSKFELHSKRSETLSVAKGEGGTLCIRLL